MANEEKVSKEVLRTPREWATERSLDIAEFAAVMVFTRWDREPHILISAAKFDEAVQAVAKIEVR